MRVKLKVYGRSTPVRHHPNAVRADGDRRYYFLGKGDDCFLSCDAADVRPRHCVIVVDDGGAMIHVVDPQGAVSVNSSPVLDRRALLSGDHLQIGSVHFGVMISDDRVAPAEPAAPPVVGQVATYDDSAADAQISQWLDSVDAIERARLMANPELRQYRPAPASPAASLLDRSEDTLELSRDDSAEMKAPAASNERSKEPGKLPPRPKPHDARSDEAAASTLTRVYGKSIHNVVKKPRD